MISFSEFTYNQFFDAAVPECVNDTELRIITTIHQYGEWFGCDLKTIHAAISMASSEILGDEH